MSWYDYIFLLFCSVQLFYYLRYFAKIAFFKDEEKEEATEPVSVIIAARNEEESLQENLPYVLKQNYPNFEVIVVNNLSEDNTLAYLETLKNDRLKVLNCTQEGKKAAIEMGVKAASYEKLLFIDADCKPSSSVWLQLMTQQINKEKQIVLGFGAFNKEKSLINKLVRFEAVLNASQYISYALRGNAYMGVGRNLAYTKTVFDNSKSFKKYKYIKSGDDDLIVNEMATRNNVCVCLHKNAHTLSNAETSWRALFHQKRRQLIAGNYYKLQHKINLGVFGATNFLYYALFITILLTGYTNTYILGIFVVKQVLEYFLFSRICKLLDDKEISKWIVIIEPLYLIFITLAGISTWALKVDKWK